MTAHIHANFCFYAIFAQTNKRKHARTLWKLRTPSITSYQSSITLGGRRPFWTSLPGYGEALCLSVPADGGLERLAVVPVSVFFCESKPCLYMCVSVCIPLSHGPLSQHLFPAVHIQPSLRVNAHPCFNQTQACFNSLVLEQTTQAQTHFVNPMRLVILHQPLCVCVQGERASTITQLND